MRSHVRFAESRAAALLAIRRNGRSGLPILTGLASANGITSDALSSACFPRKALRLRGGSRKASTGSCSVTQRHVPLAVRLLLAGARCRLGGAPSPAGASAEPPIRPNDDPPEQVRAREEAERRHPHPLSEWRDEELFRAAPFSSESPRWEETDAGRILRSRGWRPWHGSDKAPVEGPVEVRRLDGGTGTYSYTGPVLWKHFKRSDDIIAYRPVPAKAERPYEAEPTARFCWNCGTFQTDPRCNVCGVGVDERTEPAAADPTPAADAGEVERLWSLAQGIEKSLETCGHVTLDNAEWTMVCTALRVAALRPAPTEEQVERAAWRVGSHYGIHIYEGETPIATALTPEFARQIVDEHNYGARAILAIGPALQAGEGR
jgi:hypothetical protein